MNCHGTMGKSDPCVETYDLAHSSRRTRPFFIELATSRGTAQGTFCSAMVSWHASPPQGQGLSRKSVGWGMESEIQPQILSPLPAPRPTQSGDGACVFCAG